MSQYKLARRAEAALIDIYERSIETFGTYQAEAYQSGLRHTFELLAGFPEIGRYAQEYRAGYRRYRYEKHYIFYTIESDHIWLCLSSA
jgi:toxin ParE1/3/4